MADNITTIHGDKSDDSSYTASPQSPPLLTDFEIQCKQEPCSNLHNSTDEDPLASDESSSFSIPISVPTIQNPIVLLEKCDKIWETLQLIKVIQTDKSINDDTEENKEEEIQCSEKYIEKQPKSRIMNQPTLRSHNTVPFKFSVLKTRKLYPCTICGKQYMERRSLRKHSDRVHGITLPLLIKRKRVKKTSQLPKKDIDKVNPVTLLNKESNDFENLNNDKNPHAKTKVVNTKTTVLRKFVKCTLCQQKVTSIRKHLIHYHKIGGSSSMVEQLESSLLIENAASKDKEITTENVSSKKSPQPKMDTQDGFRIMDNEADTHKTSQVRKKRKYTLSYNTARKRLKLNNERYVINRHGSAVTQKQISLNHTNQKSYQCDICLGVYASPRSLYKHRRNHIFRGETKENIHNVKCRYHNSPFNKKYKLLQSSIMSTVRNTSNSMNNVQLNNETLFNQNDKISKINQAIRYNREIGKNNKTICLCGRSFRNPHTLFTHKKICELYKQEDTLSQHTNVSNDSGIGINITIKKLNDSYKIVGKDNIEDKLQESEIHFKENNLSNTSDHTTKESVNLCINKQKESDNSNSNYSKDHSFLKLQVADEDVIIDIEDDVQIKFDKNNTSKQIVTQQDDERSNGQNDVRNLKNDKQVSDKICTLRQMCKNVLEVFTHKSKNAVENESQKNSQVEDRQEDSQIKNQEIHQENKRKLRSSNKRRRNEEEVEEKFDDDDLNEIQNYMTNPLSVCGYCNKHFETINSYNNHQCTVKEGRPFDEFSLELLCFYCENVLNSFNEYDKHMRVKHFDKAYHCYLCIERFSNPKARLQHINLEHNNMPCRFCNEKLSVKVKALHEGYHLGFGFPCHKCKKAYTNGKNLSYHNYKSRLHPKTDNLVTCSICLKPIKIRSFRTHMSTHKLNACYFCGKMFSNKTGIEFHTMIHHGTQSKLKCNVCGTRFFTKKQLEKHAKVDGCNSGVQTEVKTRNFTATHH